MQLIYYNSGAQSFCQAGQIDSAWFVFRPDLLYRAGAVGPDSAAQGGQGAVQPQFSHVGRGSIAQLQPGSTGGRCCDWVPVWLHEVGRHGLGITHPCGAWEFSNRVTIAPSPSHFSNCGEACGLEAMALQAGGWVPLYYSPDAFSTSMQMLNWVIGSNFDYNHANFTLV